MATTAAISSEFVVSVTLDGAGSHVLSGPNRAFRVIEIAVYNGAGTPNITVSGAADIAPIQATATNAWKLLALTEANCDVAQSQSLTITNADASTTKVLIRCTASGGGQPLPIT